MKSKFTIILVLVFSIIITFLSLTSAGWHYADEIASGTFRGVYVFNDSVQFEKPVVFKDRTSIENDFSIRPYVSDSFDLTFSYNQTRTITLNGDFFQPNMKFLDLPEGYTQELISITPNQVKLNITAPDFNLTKTNITFQNHYPESNVMSVETMHLEKILIFTTSTTYSGDLGGLSGADQKCQLLADNAGLEGDYNALLSTSTIDAKDRFKSENSLVPIYNTNNEKVANTWNDLWIGNILANLSYDQNGNFRQSSRTMTGMTKVGEYDTSARGSGTNACGDWTISSGYRGGGGACNDNEDCKSIGDNSQINQNLWKTKATDKCGSESQPIYCYKYD